MKQREILWRYNICTHKHKMKKKQACKHTHTYRKVCLGTCNSTGVQGCWLVPVCSVCLTLTCLSCCLASKSVWCHTYSKYLPLCLSMLLLPSYPSVFVVARLSICGSVPQNVSHIKGTFLSAPRTESSHHISLFVSSAGDELKSEMW